MTSEWENRDIKLQSKENEIFTISRRVIRLSNTVNVLIVDMGLDDPNLNFDDPIPVGNVPSAILEMVIAWCNHHIDDPPASAEPRNQVVLAEDMCQWDADFLAIDQETLFELIMAANYLAIEGLLDIACKKVANIIQGKSTSEIRRTLAIPSGNTGDEEE